MKIGDRVVVTKRIHGHNYNLKQIYDICYDYGNGTYQLMKDGLRGNTSIYLDEMKLHKETITALRRQEREISQELEFIKLRLDYMNETNCKKFEDSAFLSWYLIKTLNSTDKNKEKKISKIINTISNNVNIDILKNTY